MDLRADHLARLTAADALEPVPPDMSSAVPLGAVPARMPLGEALLRLERAHAEALPVVDESGALVGAVSRAGIRRALVEAEHAGVWEALASVAEAVPGAHPREFFVNLARQLAAVLGVRWAFVGRLVDPSSVTTLAVVDGGRPVEDFTYLLAGTPCEEVVNQGPCCYPEAVQARFPQDRLLAEMGVESYVGIPLADSTGRPLGILVGLHDAPMPPSREREPLLRIFAARAAAELERLERERMLGLHLDFQRVLGLVLERAQDPGPLEGFLAYALERLLALSWMGAGAGGAVLLREGDHLVRVAARGLPEPAASQCARVPVSAPLCGRVVRERRVVRWPAGAAECPLLDAADRGGWAVPLRHGEDVLGVLLLVGGEGGGEDAIGEAFVRALGDVLGGTIARRRDLEVMRRLSVAVEQSPASVLILDPEGRIEYANAEFEAQTGYAREEVLGRRPQDFLGSEGTPPEDREALLEAMRAGREWHGVVCDRHRDGRDVWVELHVAPVRDAEGRIRHYVSMATDVTAQREAEARAERRRALLEAVTDNIDEGILVLDADTRVVWYNRRYVEQWGLEPAFLDRRPSLEEVARELCRRGVYPPEAEEAVVADRRERFARGEASWIEAPRCDGRHTDIYIHPLPDGGYLLASHDVTARVQAAEALRRRLGIEETLAEVAQVLLAGGEGGLDEAVGRLARAAHVDHAFLYIAERGGDGRITQRLRAAWDAPGRPALRERLPEVPPADYPWSRARLAAGEAVIVRAGALPKGAEAEGRFLEAAGMGTVAALPVPRAAGGIQGFLGFGDDDPQRRWDADDLRALRAACAMIGAHLARLRSEARLRASEERYALAARGANDGLWDWDILAERVYYSPRWCEMLGYAEGELAPERETWCGRIHEEDRAAFERALERHLAGETPQFVCEFRMRHRDGGYRWMLARGLAVRDEAGRAVRMAGSMTDVTERREAQEQLLREAFYDGLTGLPNRALFEDRVSAAIARARRDPARRFAVLMLDLDRFQVVNDSLGHRMGDLLIKAVASRLEALMRPGDTVARLGGDEFAVLLEEVRDATAPVAVAERLMEELAVPFELQGQQVYTGASVGIVADGSGYREPEELLRDADTALHRAKRAGRGRHELFDTAMYERARFLMGLERDLRRAIEEGGLSAAYQPIVDLEQGRRLVGFEALARWTHPGRGPVSPGEFIPVAEEAGLIVSLGWWMLREACRQVRAWREQGVGGDVHVSVNVSARQFALPDFTRRVEAILAEEGAEPAWLRLEITESVLMAGGEVVEANLRALRGMGFRIYLDDFGTGFSSLSYLHRFPVDVIKIDRSFVAPLAEPGGESGLVRSIIALARDLGKDVVAEGVEALTQETLLRVLRCRYAQGYLYAAPLPAEEAAALLAAGARLAPREAG
ncbi:EAL domain-containing protein [Inmirania thermothiophila]|uniref:PAS domain S-box-containing protein/diguanylate cyclase (GGDEF)-like protein n=1 Tax=Inmirania thermothiophila TaxID=1750597 RepID=A0A3N1Y582_9GAMM|nr:EAL domain-containing protein [Inmirania thermothiophila]ROR32792.1 PAS domain S-box-containing protein/diguanylate cyclase (GGDEF)-like protein [Inmirania thermothiophila]